MLLQIGRTVTVFFSRKNSERNVVRTWLNRISNAIVFLDRSASCSSSCSNRRPRRSSTSPHEVPIWNIIIIREKTRNTITIIRRVVYSVVVYGRGKSEDKIKFLKKLQKNGMEKTKSKHGWMFAVFAGDGVDRSRKDGATTGD